MKAVLRYLPIGFRVITFHLLRVDVCLGPFEGCRILVPTCHKSFDCFDQHADASEVSALQGATAQDAKPAFKLIEPAAVGGNKVKMHIGMGFEPAVLLAANSFMKSRNSRL